MNRKRLAIIGGGCSGLFLANLLSNSNLDIFIIEKNNKLGKKILASGNGKCNFTNINKTNDKYNNEFANLVVEKFNVEKTLQYFKNIGLIFKCDDQGRCYPVSECASSVLDCLKNGLSKVHILLECEVKGIQKCNDGRYMVEFNNDKEKYDYVACCSGSAASNLGSFKAYDYLKKLDVQLTDLQSSLTPILVEENVSSLKGMRVKCLLKLINKNSEIIYEEFGEIMFKEDALSGIAVFNASSYINRNKDDEYMIELDLSSGMNKEQLYEYIKNKKNDIDKLFKGFLNDKLAEFIINKNNLKKDYKNLEAVVDDIYGLKFKVKNLYPIKDAQVCSGGVSLLELKENLELKKYPNVYIAGELTDIDGVCGGYNMQYAWSSAGIIANDIKRKINE